jgi:GTP diphosphokinase / guanosine-3',5'-bis(diphosphate) 3'-diphosphatase
MVQRGRPYDEIYDLMAIRVVTDSIANCYHALGVIHNKWTPLQERFHDYIATPKSNMYRSLHTTIFGPRGRLYEIQIRTHEMHRTAEYGIAAHWRYKEGAVGAVDQVDETLSWFRQVLEWQQDTREPEDFMEFLRIDLFQDEIFVFTPKGDVKQLPRGATPIDFAFAVHTEVGLRCSGAKLNGRIAPLARELKNGDTVEVMTDARQKPSRDWLAFVKTARARQKIRHWIKQVETDSALQLGTELFTRELRKARKDKPSEDRLQGGGIAELRRVRGGACRAGPRRDRPVCDHEGAVPRRGGAAAAAAHRAGAAGGAGARQWPRRTHPGLDNTLVRYSQCCQPVPGDDVIGYITRGRGISIHRTDCPNVLNLSQHPERRIEIEWEAESGERFYVRIIVEGTDRRGLLSDIAAAIASTGTNISSADIKSGGWHGRLLRSRGPGPEPPEEGDEVHPSRERRHVGRAPRAFRRLGLPGLRHGEAQPGMSVFELELPFELAGDQPQAIRELSEGLAAASGSRRCSASPARARP